MGWFKRQTEGITTKEKKDVPTGIWHQCSKCTHTITLKELKENLSVCPSCGRHERVSAGEYFDMIFDDSEYVEVFSEIISKDFLHFTDLKPYDERLVEARKKTGLDDSMRVAHGNVEGRGFVVAAMDFAFIGGSMGSVVGEKISKGIDYAIKHDCAFMIISKSGGARMMESAFSLMQMAKTSAKLTLLAKAKLPYFSFLTDPTTGGVTASFAMLGDINFSEPGALIGFAGPRVVMETIKVNQLPEGFQTAEANLENGFIDFIVERKNLRSRLAELLLLFDKKKKMS